MRELLFRGQTRKHGEKVHAITGEKIPGNWVYGGIFQGQNQSIIYGYDPVEKYVVHSDTVGQYTGMPDKAGNKAFEHDCIRELYGDSIGVIRFGEYRNPFDGYGPSHVGFYVDWVSSSGKDAYRKDLGYWLNRVEVIGNIHDNPELLKGE